MEPYIINFQLALDQNKAYIYLILYVEFNIPNKTSSFFLFNYQLYNITSRCCDYRLLLHIIRLITQPAKVLSLLLPLRCNINSRFKTQSNLLIRH